MTETDLLKTTATEHHETHHETTTPDVPSDDGNTNTSQSKHEDDRDSQSKRENQTHKRSTTMRNKIAPTLAGLALTVASTFSLQTQSGNMTTTVTALTPASSTGTSIGTTTATRSQDAFTTDETKSQTRTA